MADQKRNDIGLKVLLSTLAIIITSIMGYAITSVSKVDVKTNINTVDIKGIKVGQDRTREDVKEMKADIKLILRAVSK